MELRVVFAGLGLLGLGCGPADGTGETGNEAGTSGSGTASTMATLTMTSSSPMSSTAEADATSNGPLDEGSTTASEGSTTASSDTTDGGSSGSGGQRVDLGEVQALPIVRITEVCESLDVAGDRCCLESACGDYEASVACFTGAIQEAALASGDPAMLDVIFVVDNTSDTTPMQRALALRAPQIVAALQGLEDSVGGDLGADVNLLVTTTDFGNPLCAPFETHAPEQGAPLGTPCTDRLERFTSIGGAQVDEEACTTVCPNQAGPADARPYINFGPGGDNIDDVDLVDLDGDGIQDSATSQALACMIPTGLDGCGYESPLENMFQALNPAAQWNTGGTPFLRNGANLAIVVITNEADCSITDFALMGNDTYQEVNPNTGLPAATSAICWNAGVTCDGPDGDGVWSNCTPAEGEGLQPTSRYTSYLDNLRDAQGKEIVMLVLGGVSVAGADQTVVHDWTDDDLNMADLAEGVTADQNQFFFGIAPACGGAYP